MKLERMIRYREKMDFIISSMESVPGEPKGDLEICGVFYKLHTSVEAAMDLAAMLLRDLGRKVEDDYRNLEALEELGTITGELAGGLKRCNGLRNYLVHRYNKLDEEIALGSAGDVRRTLYEFIEILERFLK
jgi:uncharacterized protein YutE (UPF0331/DUF86 family)